MATSHPAPYPQYVLDRLALWLSAERRALGRPLRIVDGDSTGASRSRAEGHAGAPRGPGHAERRVKQFVADLAGWSSDRASARVREEADRSRDGSTVAPIWVCDIFAGLGRIHDLPNHVGAETVGIEIEPEWARHRRRTLVGDATDLPREWSGLFDAVCTSPVYGSRMSDHHDAKDSCYLCQGTGTDWDESGCGDAPMLCPQCHSVACMCGGIGVAMKAHVTSCTRCRALRCGECGGSGLTKRYTYRHSLGRPLHPNNAGQMHFPSSAYKSLHKAAWAEAWRVLRPGGIMLVNVKNFLKGGVEQDVVQWHADTLRDIGFLMGPTDSIPAVGLRHAGDNADVRVMEERIITARKPLDC